MASDLGERAKAYARETKWAETSRVEDWLAGYRAAIVDAAKVAEEWRRPTGQGDYRMGMDYTAEQITAAIRELASPA